jgi:hypothetical protein
MSTLLFSNTTSSFAFPLPLTSFDRSPSAELVVFLWRSALLSSGTSPAGFSDEKYPPFRAIISFSPSTHDNAYSIDLPLTCLGGHELALDLLLLPLLLISLYHPPTLLLRLMGLQLHLWALFVPSA